MAATTSSTGQVSRLQQTTERLRVETSQLRARLRGERDAVRALRAQHAAELRAERAAARRRKVELEAQLQEATKVKNAAINAASTCEQCAKTRAQHDAEIRKINSEFKKKEHQLKGQLNKEYSTNLVVANSCEQCVKVKALHEAEIRKLNSEFKKKEIQLKGQLNDKTVPIVTSSSSSISSCEQCVKVKALHEAELRKVNTEFKKKEQQLKGQLNEVKKVASVETTSGGICQTCQRLNADLAKQKENSKELEERLQKVIDADRFKAADLRAQHEKHVTELSRITRANRHDAYKLLEELKTKDRIIEQLRRSAGKSRAKGEDAGNEHTQMRKLREEVRKNEQPALLPPACDPKPESVTNHEKFRQNEIELNVTIKQRDQMVCGAATEELTEQPETDTDSAVSSAPSSLSPQPCSPAGPVLRDRATSPPTSLSPQPSEGYTTPPPGLWPDLDSYDDDERGNSELSMARRQVRELERALLVTRATKSSSHHVTTLSERVRQLEDREAELLRELGDLREQNELLEFRVLELAECPDKSSFSTSSWTVPDHRDVSTATDDVAERLNDEPVRRRIADICSRTDDLEDKRCLMQVLVLLHGLDELSRRTEPYDAEAAMQIYNEREHTPPVSLTNVRGSRDRTVPDRDRLVAKVPPFTGRTADSDDDRESPLRSHEPSTSPAPVNNRGTQTDVTETSEEEDSTKSLNLTAEVRKLDKLRETIDRNGRLVVSGSGCLGGCEQKHSRQLEFYRERVDVLERKLCVYESSGELQARQLAERLSREVRLEAEVKQLNASVHKLQSENSRLEEERCELEEAENDTRLHCQRLETDILQLERSRMSAKRRARDSRQQASYWENMVSKYEERNYELEERECELRHRLEVMEKTAPAILLFNMWKMMQDDPKLDVTSATIDRLKRAGSRSRSRSTQRSSSGSPDRKSNNSCICRHGNVENKIKTLENQRDKLMEAKQDMERKVIALESQLNDLKHSATNTPTSPQSAAMSGPSRASLMSGDFELMNVVQDLRERENQMRKRIDDLEQREAAYMETLQQADEIWADMETGYKKRISDAEQSEADMRDRLRRVEKRGPAPCVVCDDLEDSERKFTAQAQRFSRENSRLHAENKRLERELSCICRSRDDKLREMEAQADKLTGELERERRRSQVLEQRLSDGEAALSEAVSTHATEAESLRERLARTANELVHLEVTNGELREEVETLESKIADVERGYKARAATDEQIIRGLSQELNDRDKELCGMKQKSFASEAGERLDSALQNVKTCDVCKQSVSPDLVGTVEGVRTLCQLMSCPSARPPDDAQVRTRPPPQKPYTNIICENLKQNFTVRKVETVRKEETLRKDELCITQTCPKFLVEKKITARKEEVASQYSSKDYIRNIETVSKEAIRKDDVCVTQTCPKFLVSKKTSTSREKILSEYSSKDYVRNIETVIKETGREDDVCVTHICPKFLVAKETNTSKEKIAFEYSSKDYVRKIETVSKEETTRKDDVCLTQTCPKFLVAKKTSTSREQIESEYSSNDYLRKVKIVSKEETTRKDDLCVTQTCPKFLVAKKTSESKEKITSEYSSKESSVSKLSSVDLESSAATSRRTSKSGISTPASIDEEPAAGDLDTSGELDATQLENISTVGAGEAVAPVILRSSLKGPRTASEKICPHDKKTSRSSLISPCEEQSCLAPCSEMSLESSVGDGIPSTRMAPRDISEKPVSEKKQVGEVLCPVATELLYKLSGETTCSKTVCKAPCSTATLASTTSTASEAETEQQPTEQFDLLTEVIVAGQPDYSAIQAKVDMDTEHEIEGITIMATVTESGNLEILTESPPGLIEHTMMYTPSGNMEIITGFSGRGSTDLDQVPSYFHREEGPTAPDKKTQKPIVLLPDVAHADQTYDEPTRDTDGLVSTETTSAASEIGAGDEPVRDVETGAEATPINETDKDIGEATALDEAVRDTGDLDETVIDTGAVDEEHSYPGEEKEISGEVIALDESVRDTDDLNEAVEEPSYHDKEKEMSGEATDEAVRDTGDLDETVIDTGAVDEKASYPGSDKAMSGEAIALDETVKDIGVLDEVVIDEKVSYPGSEKEISGEASALDEAVKDIGDLDEVVIDEKASYPGSDKEISGEASALDEAVKDIGGLDEVVIDEKASYPGSDKEISTEASALDEGVQDTGDLDEIVIDEVVIDEKASYPGGDKEMGGEATALEEGVKDTGDLDEVVIDEVVIDEKASYPGSDKEMGGEATALDEAVKETGDLDEAIIDEKASYPGSDKEMDGEATALDEAVKETGDLDEAIIDEKAYYPGSDKEMGGEATALDEAVKETGDFDEAVIDEKASYPGSDKEMGGEATALDEAIKDTDDLDEVVIDEKASYPGSDKEMSGEVTALDEAITDSGDLDEAVINEKTSYPGSDKEMSGEATALDEAVKDTGDLDEAVIGTSAFDETLEYEPSHPGSEKEMSGEAITLDETVRDTGDVEETVIDTDAKDEEPCSPGSETHISVEVTVLDEAVRDTGDLDKAVEEARALEETVRDICDLDETVRDTDLDVIVEREPSCPGSEIEIIVEAATLDEAVSEPDKDAGDLDEAVEREPSYPGSEPVVLDEPVRDTADLDESLHLSQAESETDSGKGAGDRSIHLPEAEADIYSATEKRLSVTFLDTSEAPKIQIKELGYDATLRSEGSVEASLREQEKGSTSSDIIRKSSTGSGSSLIELLKEVAHSVEKIAELYERVSKSPTKSLEELTEDISTKSSVEETIFTLDAGLETVASDDKEVKTVTSDSKEVETVAPSDRELESVTSSDKEEETIVSINKEVEIAASSTDKDMEIVEVEIETIVISDEELETVISIDKERETVADGDEETKTTVSDEKEVETVVSSNKEVETVASSFDKDIEIDVSGYKEVETVVISAEELETVISIDKEIETVTADDEEIKTTVSDEKEVETVVSSDKEIETVISADKELETMVSGDKEIETVVSDGKEEESVASSDKELETVISGDIEIETVAIGDKEIETAVSSDKEEESVASSDKELEIVISSDNEIKTIAAGDEEIKTVVSGDKEQESVASSDKELETVISSASEIETVAPEGKELEKIASAKEENEESSSTSSECSGCESSSSDESKSTETTPETQLEETQDFRRNARPEEETIEGTVEEPGPDAESKEGPKIEPQEESEKVPEEKSEEIEEPEITTSISKPSTGSQTVRPKSDSAICSCALGYLPVDLFSQPFRSQGLICACPMYGNEQQRQPQCMPPHMLQGGMPPQQMMHPQQIMPPQQMMYPQQMVHPHQMFPPQQMMMPQQMIPPPIMSPPMSFYQPYVPCPSYPPLPAPYPPSPYGFPGTSVPYEAPQFYPSQQNEQRPPQDVCAPECPGKRQRPSSAGGPPPNLCQRNSCWPYQQKNMQFEEMKPEELPEKVPKQGKQVLEESLKPICSTQQSPNESFRLCNKLSCPAFVKSMKDRELEIKSIETKLDRELEQLEQPTEEEPSEGEAISEVVEDEGAIEEPTGEEPSEEETISEVVEDDGAVEEPTGEEVITGPTGEEGIEEGSPEEEPIEKGEAEKEYGGEDLIIDIVIESGSDVYETAIGTPEVDQETLVGKELTIEGKIEQPAENENYESAAGTLSVSMEISVDEVCTPGSHKSKSLLGSKEGSVKSGRASAIKSLESEGTESFASGETSPAASTSTFSSAKESSRSKSSAGSSKRSTTSSGSKIPVPIESPTRSSHISCSECSEGSSSKSSKVSSVKLSSKGSSAKSSPKESTDKFSSKESSAKSSPKKSADKFSSKESSVKSSPKESADKFSSKESSAKTSPKKSSSKSSPYDSSAKFSPKESSNNSPIKSSAESGKNSPTKKSSFESSGSKKAYHGPDCICKLCKCCPCKDTRIKPRKRPDFEAMYPAGSCCPKCMCEVCRCPDCIDPNRPKLTPHESGLPCDCEECECDPCKDPKILAAKSESPYLNVPTVGTTSTQGSAFTPLDRSQPSMPFYNTVDTPSCNPIDCLQPSAPFYNTYEAPMFNPIDRSQPSMPLYNTVEIPSFTPIDRSQPSIPLYNTVNVPSFPPIDRSQPSTPFYNTVDIPSLTPIDRSRPLYDTGVSLPSFPQYQTANASAIPSMQSSVTGETSLATLQSSVTGDASLGPMQPSAPDEASLGTIEISVSGEGSIGTMQSSVTGENSLATAQPSGTAPVYGKPPLESFDGCNIPCTCGPCVCQSCGDVNYLIMLSDSIKRPVSDSGVTYAMPTRTTNGQPGTTATQPSRTYPETTGGVSSRTYPGTTSGVSSRTYPGTTGGVSSTTTPGSEVVRPPADAKGDKSTAVSVDGKSIEIVYPASQPDKKTLNITQSYAVNCSCVLCKCDPCCAASTTAAAPHNADDKSTTIDRKATEIIYPASRPDKKTLNLSLPCSFGTLDKTQCAPVECSCVTCKCDPRSVNLLNTTDESTKNSEWHVTHNPPDLGTSSEYESTETSSGEGNLLGLMRGLKQQPKSDQPCSSVKGIASTCNKSVTGCKCNTCSVTLLNSTNESTKNSEWHVTHNPPDLGTSSEYESTETSSGEGNLLGLMRGLKQQPKSDQPCSSVKGIASTCNKSVTGCKCNTCSVTLLNSTNESTKNSEWHVTHNPPDLGTSSEYESTETSSGEGNLLGLMRGLKQQPNSDKPCSPVKNIASTCNKSVTGCKCDTCSVTLLNSTNASTKNSEWHVTHNPPDLGTSSEYESTETSSGEGNLLGLMRGLKQPNSDKPCLFVKSIASTCNKSVTVCPSGQTVNCNCCSCKPSPNNMVAETQTSKIGTDVATCPFMQTVKVNDRSINIHYPVKSPNSKLLNVCPSGHPVNCQCVNCACNPCSGKTKKQPVSKSGQQDPFNSVECQSPRENFVPVAESTRIGTDVCPYSQSVQVAGRAINITYPRDADSKRTLNICPSGHPVDCQCVTCVCNPCSKNTPQSAVSNKIAQRYPESKQPGNVTFNKVQQETYDECVCKPKETGQFIPVAESTRIGTDVCPYSQSVQVAGRAINITYPRDADSKRTLNICPSGHPVDCQCVKCICNPCSKNTPQSAVSNKAAQRYPEPKQTGNVTFNKVQQETYDCVCEPEETGQFIPDAVSTRIGTDVCPYSQSVQVAGRAINITYPRDADSKKTLNICPSGHPVDCQCVKCACNPCSKNTPQSAVSNKIAQRYPESKQPGNVTFNKVQQETYDCVCEPEETGQFIPDAVSTRIGTDVCPYSQSVQVAGRTINITYPRDADSKRTLNICPFGHPVDCQCVKCICNPCSKNTPQSAVSNKAAQRYPEPKQTGNVTFNKVQQETYDCVCEPEETGQFIPDAVSTRIGTDVCPYSQSVQVAGRPINITYPRDAESKRTLNICPSGHPVDCQCVECACNPCSKNREQSTITKKAAQHLEPKQLANVTYNKDQQVANEYVSDPDETGQFRPDAASTRNDGDVCPFSQSVQVAGHPINITYPRTADSKRILNICPSGHPVDCQCVICVCNPCSKNRAQSPITKKAAQHLEPKQLANVTYNKDQQVANEYVSDPDETGQFIPDAVSTRIDGNVCPFSQSVQVAGRPINITYPRDADSKRTLNICPSGHPVDCQCVECACNPCSKNRAQSPITKKAAQHLEPKQLANVTFNKDQQETYDECVCEPEEMGQFRPDAASTRNDGEICPYSQSVQVAGRPINITYPRNADSKRTLNICPSGHPVDCQCVMCACNPCSKKIAQSPITKKAAQHLEPKQLANITFNKDQQETYDECVCEPEEMGQFRPDAASTRNDGEICPYSQSVQVAGRPINITYPRNADSKRTLNICPSGHPVDCQCVMCACNPCSKKIAQSPITKKAAQHLEPKQLANITFNKDQQETYDECVCEPEETGQFRPDAASTRNDGEICPYSQSVQVAGRPINITYPRDADSKRTLNICPSGHPVDCQCVMCACNPCSKKIAQSPITKKAAQHLEPKQLANITFNKDQQETYDECVCEPEETGQFRPDAVSTRNDGAVCPYSQSVQVAGRPINITYPRDADSKRTLNICPSGHPVDCQCVECSCNPCSKNRAQSPITKKAAQHLEPKQLANVTLNKDQQETYDECVCEPEETGQFRPDAASTRNDGEICPYSQSVQVAGRPINITYPRDADSKRTLNICPSGHPVDCQCVICACNPCSKKIAQSPITKKAAQHLEPKQLANITFNKDQRETYDECVCEPEETGQFRPDVVSTRNDGDVCPFSQLVQVAGRPINITYPRDADSKRTLNICPSGHPVDCQCVKCACNPCSKNTPQSAVSNKAAQQYLEPKQLGNVTYNKGQSANAGCVCKPDKMKDFTPSAESTRNDAVCPYSQSVQVAGRAINITYSRDADRKRTLNICPSGHPVDCQCVICACNPCSKNTPQSAVSNKIVRQYPEPKQLGNVTYNKDQTANAGCMCKSDKMRDFIPSAESTRNDAVCPYSQIVQVAGRAINITYPRDADSKRTLNICPSGHPVDCQCVKCICNPCSKNTPQSAVSNKGAQQYPKAKQPANALYNKSHSASDVCVCKSRKMDNFVPNAESTRTDSNVCPYSQSVQLLGRTINITYPRNADSKRTLNICPSGHPVDCHCITCVCNPCSKDIGLESNAGTVNNAGFVSSCPYEYSVQVANRKIDIVYPRSASSKRSLNVCPSGHPVDCQCVYCICDPCSKEIPGHTSPKKGGHHPMCDCPQCVCDPCAPDPPERLPPSKLGPAFVKPTLKSTGSSRLEIECSSGQKAAVWSVAVKGTEDLRNLDTETLKRKLVEMENETKERANEIAQIRKFITGLQCTCGQKEKENQALALTESRSFDQTISGLQCALAFLQEKCRKKDRMIVAFSEELRLRADSGVFNTVLHKIAAEKEFTPNADFDRFGIAKLLPTPTDMSRQVMRTPAEKPCAPVKPSSSVNDDCSCMSGTAKGVDPSPLAVTEVRQISVDSLLLKWERPASQDIKGYEVEVNGELKCRIHSAGRTATVLTGVLLNGTMNLSVIAISTDGDRCLPAATAIYQTRPSSPFRVRMKGDCMC